MFDKFNQVYLVLLYNISVKTNNIIYNKYYYEFNQFKNYIPILYSLYILEMKSCMSIK